MTAPLRLILVLHQHQPVGNLDAVVERAYQQCYLPLQTTLGRLNELPYSLHLSGALYDWLSTRHPEYLDRLAAHVAAGQVEILGGPQYDPILPMLPRCDRVGQVVSYGRVLEARFGSAPLGAWLPERVWEPALASDLAAAGIEHTVLDDTHFHAAGLPDDRLHGYYLTEDHGRIIALFPGDRELRYMIPFAAPEEVIAYLRQLAEKSPGGVAVYADDAEKFGFWPGMKQHVFDDGWLAQFQRLLAANRDWLSVTTLRETIDHVAPLGKVYVPDGGYQEMNRWASLAGSRTEALRDLRRRADDETPTTVDQLVEHQPGAVPPAEAARSSWRNFRVKYPEIDEMYARVLTVSRRVQAAAAAGHPTTTVEQARQHLYRAECNCPFWHGVFGGVYLPHLRQSVYRELLAAEALLDTAEGRRGTWIEAVQHDFDLDVHKEVCLSNEQVTALVAPARGGRLYEFDQRAAGCNLLATLARRPETYHEAALQPGALWFDRTTQDGLAVGPLGPQPGQRLVYDDGPRKCLVDRCYDLDCSLAAVVEGRARDRGDFAGGLYEVELERKSSSARVVMRRTGQAVGRSVTVTKQISLTAGSNELLVDYLLEGLTHDRPFQLAIEFNFATLPLDGSEGLVRDGLGQTISRLGRVWERDGLEQLAVVGRETGVEVDLQTSRPAGVWSYPIRTLSRFQEGFEWIEQGVALTLHWPVVADAQGRWQLQLRLAAAHQVVAGSAAYQLRVDRPGENAVKAPHRGRARKPATR